MRLPYAKAKALADDVLPLTIRIDAVPPKATAQQKGICMVGGKPRFFKKTRQAIDETNTVALLVAHKPAGMKPIDGAIRFTLKMVWPYKKSERKAVVRAGLEVPIPTRPDNTNLAKMMEDAITAAGYWHDDSQCSTTIIQKRWGPVGYWEIQFERDEGT